MTPDEQEPVPTPTGEVNPAPTPESSPEPTPTENSSVPEPVAQAPKFEAPPAEPKKTGIQDGKWVHDKQADKAKRGKKSRA